MTTRIHTDVFVKALKKVGLVLPAYNTAKHNKTARSLALEHVAF